LVGVIYFNTFGLYITKSHISFIQIQQFKPRNTTGTGKSLLFFFFHKSQAIMAVSIFLVAFALSAIVTMKILVYLEIFVSLIKNL